MKKIEITKNSKLGRAIRVALAKGRMVVPIPDDGVIMREYKEALEEVGHALVRAAHKAGW